VIGSLSLLIAQLCSYQQTDIEVCLSVCPSVCLSVCVVLPITWWTALTCATSQHALVNDPSHSTSSSPLYVYLCLSYLNVWARERTG